LISAGLRRFDQDEIASPQPIERRKHCRHQMSAPVCGIGACGAPCPGRQPRVARRLPIAASTNTGFMSTVGDTPQARAWQRLRPADSPPSTVTPRV